MNNLSRKVLALTIQVEMQKRFMRKQPWYGQPVIPPARVLARHQLHTLEDELEDAINKLVDSIE